jgi:hypothetical protein
MSRFTDIDLENKKLPAICGYWSAKLVSLEQALQPIEPFIEQLGRSIKAAKKYCRFPSEHGLTHDESAAVYLYTMEGGENSFYLILNQALRSEDRPALRPWFAFLKLFDQALSKLPTVKGNLWRGISEDVTRNFRRGQELTWWSISSCSTSLVGIKSFLGSDKISTLFMIEAVNGKDVTGYTNFPTENEVLLGLGTHLRVKDDALEHLGGLNIIQLMEISENDDTAELLPKTLAKLDLQPKSSEKATVGK